MDETHMEPDKNKQSTGEEAGENNIPNSADTSNELHFPEKEMVEEDSAYQADDAIDEQEVPHLFHDENPADNLALQENIGTDASDLPHLSDEMETDDDLIFQENTVDLTVLKLEGIEQQLAGLHQEFQDKLKYDAHKEKIIDDLYQELQAYKNDLIKKQMGSVVTDLIKIIDDIRKLTQFYRAKEPSSEDLPKLLNILEDIPSDLEDLISFQGVSAFTCDGVVLDPKRQKVVKKIETSDQSKDKTVAGSLRPGYEWDGRVIRHEMVEVYEYMG